MVEISRSVAGYIARQREDEAELIEKIHKLAIRNSRYGYRRIAVLLRREGCRINRKRVHHIWKSEGLSLPLRRPRRRRVGPAGEVVNKAEYPNHVWSYDFIEDRTEKGGKLRTLAIIDEYTRESLAVRVEPSIPARAVVEVLEWLLLTRGVRSISAVITVLNSPQEPSVNGSRRMVARPYSSPREVPGRTATLRVSSLNCGMNV